MDLDPATAATTPAARDRARGERARAARRERSP